METTENYYTSNIVFRFSINCIVFLLALAVLFAVFQYEESKLANKLVGTTQIELRVSEEEVQESVIDEALKRQVQIDKSLLPLVAREEEMVPFAEFTAYYEYTEEDVDLLARLMYAEEGVLFHWLDDEEEVKEAHMLAGSVVLNRIGNEAFNSPQTLEDVINMPGQYSCVSNGSINNPAPDIVHEWAEELLRRGPIGPDNLVFQSQSTQGSGTYRHISNQYFCVL